MPLFYSFRHHKRKSHAIGATHYNKMIMIAMIDGSAIELAW